MIGKYVFSVDGEIVGESTNVITADGKVIIAKYLAGIAGSYAGAIAVGVGTTAATASDKALEYEFARAPIVMRNVTGPSGEIFQASFKAVLPEQLDGFVRESGLISQTFNNSAGTYGDRQLARFHSGEGWGIVSSANMDLTYETTGYDAAGDSVRIGEESARLKASSASSPNMHLQSTVIQGDLSGYSSADQFALAMSGYYVSSGTSIEVRFYSDANSYWFANLTPATNTSSTWQYQIIKFYKTDFSQSGTPDWSNIIKSSVLVSTNNANTNLILDGLSIFDTDYVNPDYVMTSRSIAPVAVRKELGKTMDVEYFLEFKL